MHCTAETQLANRVKKLDTVKTCVLSSHYFSRMLMKLTMTRSIAYFGGRGLYYLYRVLEHELFSGTVTETNFFHLNNGERVLGALT